ncbi:hypothetical protein F4808DRAFT_269405 [Astrocystis sublimbata]|nr:hypothetical protein F4808DRAFT_269405 [Astrocystis sublimbata]
MRPSFVAANKLCAYHSGPVSHPDPKQSLVYSRAEVRDAIDLAQAQSIFEEQQSQRQERNAADRHRLALTSFISSSDREISEAQKWRTMADVRSKAENNQRRLDHLSTFDYIRAFNQARSKRYHSTGEWVFQTPEWCRWKDEDCSSVCWLSGKIGSGKTVLSATITDHLLAKRRASDSISFFFPRFDNEESLLADTIIRSLIRQNLQPDLVDKLSNELQKAHDSCYSQEALTELLMSKMAMYSTNYIVIDSLDECEPKERRMILDILGTTIKRNSSKIKIILASRDSLETEVANVFGQVPKLRMNSPKVISDLKLYARQNLSERMNMGQLPIGNVVSLEDICEAVTSGAQGMFLWVALEIDDLCFQVCEEDVANALRELPNTLTEVFNRALSRILSQKTHRIAKDIFQWVSVTKRPLTLDEIQDALSIEVGETYSKPERRPKNINMIPTWCANLVEIDEASASVQFIHHCVRTFILDTSIIDPHSHDLNDFHRPIDDLNTNVGELCVTYLEWNDFKKTLVGSESPPVNTQLPHPRQIAKTALAAEWQSNPIAMIGSFIPQLSTRDARCKFNIDAIMQTNSRKQAGNIIYPLLGYAKRYWINHTRLLKTTSPIYRPWRHMLEGIHPIAQTEWTRDEYISADEFILAWAQTHCHSAMIYELLAVGYIGLDTFLYYSCSIIAGGGPLRNVQSTLEVISSFTPRHWTKDMVISMEIQTVIAYLLSTAQAYSIEQAWSKFKNHQELRLLEDKLNIDRIADHPDLLEILFFTSIQSGLAELVTKTRVKEPASRHNLDSMPKKPLHVAIMAENMYSINMLLKRDPFQDNATGLDTLDPSSYQKHRLDSFLHMAINQQNVTSAHFLLGQGARVNFKPLVKTKRQCRCSRVPRPKNLDPGRIMISQTHNVSIRPRSELFDWHSTGQLIEHSRSRSAAELTPLYYAVQVGCDVSDVELINLLLAYGADPNIPSSHDLTPIFLAIHYDQPEILEILLQAGANPYLVCLSGATAEEYAQSIRSKTAKDSIQNTLVEVSMGSKHRQQAALFINEAIS